MFDIAHMVMKQTERLIMKILGISLLVMFLLCIIGWAIIFYSKYLFVIHIIKIITIVFTVILSLFIIGFIGILAFVGGLCLCT